MKAAAEKVDVYPEPHEPLEVRQREAQPSPGVVLAFPTQGAREKRRRSRLRGILAKWFCPTGFLGI